MIRLIKSITIMHFLNFQLCVNLSYTAATLHPSPGGKATS